MKFLLLFFLLNASSVANSQDVNNEISKSNKKFIKIVSRIIKEKSLFTGFLDWKHIPNELKRLPFRNIDSIDRNLVLNYFITSLKSVGDNHSLFVTQATIKTLTSDSSVATLSESKYLGSGIGYIKVPKCMTFDKVKDREYANSIRSQIRRLDIENDIVGWVIDLRNNNGGNMWPMVAGLNALMYDGTIGYLIGANGKKHKEWKTDNGTINYSKETIALYKVKKMNPKIAVLVNSKTASSGEMTAISLLGLPNVKSFGQPTAGFTTTNSTFYFPNGTQLFLASHYVADQKFKLYPERIRPDVIMNTPNTFNDDEILEYSKKWILEDDDR